LGLWRIDNLHNTSVLQLGDQIIHILGAATTLADWRLLHLRHSAKQHIMLQHRHVNKCRTRFEPQSNATTETHVRREAVSMSRSSMLIVSIFFFRALTMSGSLM